MSGVSLGEIAVTANELIHDTDCDEECFVLLGDPDDEIDVGKVLGFDRKDTVSTSVFNDEWELGGANLSSEQTAADPQLVKSFVVSPNDPVISQTIVSKIPDEIVQFAMKDSKEISSSQILRALIHSDNREGLWLTLKYGGAHKLTTDKVSCLWCRSPSVVYSRKRGTSWSRMIVNCPRCGIIADIPTGNYEKLSLELPDVLSKGQEFELRSTYVMGQFQMGAACGFSLIHCLNFGWSSFEQSTPTMAVDGGRFCRRRFYVSFGSLPRIPICLLG